MRRFFQFAGDLTIYVDAAEALALPPDSTAKKGFELARAWTENVA
jgi:hypothetical protein